MELVNQVSASPLFSFLAGLALGGVLTALGLHKWRKTDEAGYQDAAARIKRVGDKE